MKQYGDQKPVAKETLEIKNKMHSYALFFPVLVIAIERGLRDDGDEFKKKEVFCSQENHSQKPLVRIINP